MFSVSFSMQFIMLKTRNLAPSKLLTWVLDNLIILLRQALVICMGSVEGCSPPCRGAICSCLSGACLAYPDGCCDDDTNWCSLCVLTCDNPENSPSRKASCAKKGDNWLKCHTLG